MSLPSIMALCFVCMLPAAEPAVDFRPQALWPRLVAATSDAEQLPALVDLVLAEGEPWCGSAGPIGQRMREAAGCTWKLGVAAPLLPTPAEGTQHPPELLAAWCLSGLRTRVLAYLDKNPQAAAGAWKHALPCLASRDWRPLWQRHAAGIALDAREQAVLAWALGESGLGSRCKALPPVARQSPWMWTLGYDQENCIVSDYDTLIQDELRRVLPEANPHAPAQELWALLSADQLTASAQAERVQAIWRVAMARTPQDDPVLIRRPTDFSRLCLVRDLRSCQPGWQPDEWKDWVSAWTRWSLGETCGSRAGLVAFGTWLANRSWETAGRRDGATNAAAEACRQHLLTAVAMDPGDRELAELAPRLLVMPDYERLPPAGAWIDRQVNFKDLSEHIPGELRGDDYAIRWQGFLRIVKPGTHVFTLDSDDGTRLYIDGQLIVDHHGRHAAVYDFIQAQGKIELAAGDHDLRLDYYEAGGGQAARLGWIPPGCKQPELVPPEMFVHGDTRQPGLAATWFRLDAEQVPESELAAAAILRRLADQHPWNVQLLEQVAEQDREVGRNAQALLLLRQVLDLAPERHNARIAAAHLLSAQGRAQEAIGLLEAGLSFPEAAALHLALAQTELASGDRAAALRRLQLAGDDRPVLELRAEICEALGLSADARAAYGQLGYDIDLLRLDLQVKLADREALRGELAQLAPDGMRHPLSWSRLGLALWRHGAAGLLPSNREHGNMQELATQVLASCEKGMWARAWLRSQILRQWGDNGPIGIGNEPFATWLLIHGILAGMHGDPAPMQADTLAAVDAETLPDDLRRAWTRLRANRPAPADAQGIDGWMEALRLLARGRHDEARAIATRLSEDPAIGGAARALRDWYATQTPESLQALPRDQRPESTGIIDDGNGAEGF